MDKERFDNALMGYLYGELTPPEEEAFLAHCRTHPEAMKELDALGGVRKTLALAAPLEDPPSAITARILDAARQAAPSAGSAASAKAAAGAPQGFLGWLGRRPWLMGLAATGAAVAGLLVVGTGNLQKMAKNASAPAARSVSDGAPARDKAPTEKMAPAAADPKPAEKPKEEELAGAAGDEPMAQAPPAEPVRKKSVPGAKAAMDRADRDEARPAKGGGASTLSNLPADARTGTRLEEARLADAEVSGVAKAKEEAPKAVRVSGGENQRSAAQGTAGGGMGRGSVGATATHEGSAQYMAPVEAPAEKKADKAPESPRPVAISPLMSLPARPQNKDQAFGSAGNAMPPPPPAAAAPSPVFEDDSARPDLPPARALGKASGLKIARAEREEQEQASSERKRMADDFKTVKKTQTAMRAQDELTAGTEQLASGQPQTALEMFKRAEAQDVSKELAPNPRTGQAVALARLNRCTEARTVVKSVTTTHPRFSQLPGVLEEVAQCFDRAHDEVAARALRQDARVAQAATPPKDPAALASRAGAIGRQVRGDPRALAGCEMAGTAAGELPSAAGAYNIVLTVNTEGVPTDVTVRGPKPAPRTQQCLDMLLRTQRYLPGTSSQQVDLTLVLQARASGGSPAAAKKEKAGPPNTKVDQAR